MEIARGAEAVIERHDGIIRKTRIKKSYRLKELDTNLRRSRTRREAKVLKKLATIGVAAPELISADSESVIDMAYIDGPKLRDVLEKKDLASVGRTLASMIATMHKNGIIHGDLTTSNIIEHRGYVFVDFGLSYFSEKDEDKAVDLHLLSQAVWSKHYTVAETFLDELMQEYARHDGGAQVLSRLEKVRARGRNKGK